MGQTSNGPSICRRRLSSFVTRRICTVTHQGAARDGGLVVLRPVRATPCFNRYSRPSLPYKSEQKSNVEGVSRIENIGDASRCRLS